MKQGITIINSLKNTNSYSSSEADLFTEILSIISNKLILDGSSTSQKQEILEVDNNYWHLFKLSITWADFSLLLLCIQVVFEILDTNNSKIADDTNSKVYYNILPSTTHAIDDKTYYGLYYHEIKDIKLFY